MSQIFYLSAERLKQIQQELIQLKTVKRREVADRIEIAKALGDLAENAEYHEAKDEMILLETKIAEFEDIVKNAKIIEEQGGSAGIVRVGSVVKVQMNGKEKTYQIVGSTEADPVTGKVSNESPIGVALLGAKVGDEVRATTPAGPQVYKILQVG